MTKNEFILKYTHDLGGQDEVPFSRVVAVLEDIADRGCGAEQALTASTVGLAKIGAATGFVVVTSANANNIIHLPAAADLQVGHIVRGKVGANGCEMRVAVADDAVVALNSDSTTVHEAALSANDSFIAVLVTATAWILTAFAAAGTVSTPAPDA